MFYNSMMTMKPQNFIVPGWLRFIAVLAVIASASQLIAMNAYEKDLLLGLMGLEVADPKVTAKNVFYTIVLIGSGALLFVKALPWLILSLFAYFAISNHGNEFNFRSFNGMSMDSLPSISSAQVSAAPQRPNTPQRTTNRHAAATRWASWGVKNGYHRGRALTTAELDWCFKGEGKKLNTNLRHLKCMTRYNWSK